jgi:NAD(P)-dependent dehydrogenase (short-subunit alcohol dehydrogenase family)
MRFQDRVAIVTGGASGIGLATARRLCTEGAHVVIADLAADRADTAAAGVRAGGCGKTLGSCCDVAKEEDVAATVALALERFGRLDIVVNNAGLMMFKPLVELTREDWERTLAVDLLGVFYFIREAFRHMSEGGAVVNVSSVHAVETSPRVAPYAAAKAAVLSLTRSAAIEGAARHIRVNAVLPGAVDTGMLWSNPNIRSGVEKIDEADVGRPEDIAAAITYLASDDAAFITGSALNVDGGRLARL